MTVEQRERDAAPAAPAPESLPARVLHALWSSNPATVTVLAIVLALLAGAVLMVVSDADIRAMYSYLFARPSDALRASADKVGEAYADLFRGAVVSPSALAAALTGTGDWATALRPLSETLTATTPLVFTGLAFTLAFRGGLFNIGVQGQAILGAAGAALVGFLLPLPVVLHLLVALLGGALGGALWGLAPGLLKARTGAHEVITTIMLNWVALIFLAWLIIQPGIHDPERRDAISRPVADTARLFRLPEWTGLSGLRVHFGIVLAVAAVVAVSWLLRRATFGFELRAVGSNPDASRTAGIRVGRTYVLVMVVAGALAGLGGTSVVLGTATTLTPQVIGNVGFDGILVGLLGRARPWGVFLAALLFGALQAGGRTMQTSSQISLELVQVIQALIVIFVAAPALVKALFRLRAARAGGVATASGRGW